jgi:hypothetical protein
MQAFRAIFSPCVMLNDNVPEFTKAADIVRPMIGIATGKCSFFCRNLFAALSSKIFGVFKGEITYASGRKKGTACCFFSAGILPITVTGGHKGTIYRLP